MSLFKKRIYLDYASLTPVDPLVLGCMEKYYDSKYANPASLYKEGVCAKAVLADMRQRIAHNIHAHADEIVFTAGGTEANSLAIQGVVVAARKNGISNPRVIISAIEHSSVLETAKMLSGYGCEVVTVPVNKQGTILLDELKNAITPETVLVSVMTVNNEIGSIQPIREIAHIIRKARSTRSQDGLEQSYPLFHTDAAQGVLFQELFVEKLGVDLMTLDGAKIYGPRGVGCLFVKRGTSIEPIVYGGGQERGIRSGTENIPAIAGFAKALEIAEQERGKETARIALLKSFFAQELINKGVKFKINGFFNHGANLDSLPAGHNVHDKEKIDEKFVDSGKSSPHILNISFPGIDNEFFLFQLDSKGISCSAKSSCLRDEEESYVLRSIGADSRSSIRFSFGRWTTKREIRAALKVVRDILIA